MQLSQQSTQSTSPRVLVIDDDPGLNELLREYLQAFGFCVNGALLPSIGLELLAQWHPDVVIIDFMMPEMNGLDLCQKIRTTHPLLPVLMLTARGEPTDKIVGLEMGMDDYLAKPFEPRELVARLRALLRRTANIAQTRLNRAQKNVDVTQSAYAIVLDVGRQGLWLADKWIAVQHNEMIFLQMLFDAAPNFVDRDRIANKLYGRDLGHGDRGIDVMVSRLRRKIGDNSRNPTIIGSARNAGYRLLEKSF